MRVTVGEYDLRSAETASESDKKVSKIHLHPEYKCSRFVHDIALLELENEIYWTASVGPACLPLTQESTGFNSYSDRAATAAGWGWMNENYSKGNILL